MKALTAIFFLLMCAAQWYVPVSLIVTQENVIRNGRTLHFKTEPIDPSDPFRGKYVTLRFQEERLNLKGRAWEPGMKMFAVIEEGSDGFAVVSDIVDTPPDNMDYMPVIVEHGDNERVRVRFPFDRYYVEESKAPIIERIYWDNLSDTTRNVYAVVRIKDGTATLQDLMIDDQSVIDLVRQADDIY